MAPSTSVCRPVRHCVGRWTIHICILVVYFPFYLQLPVRGSFCSVCVQLSLHYLCAPTVFFTSCHLNCGSATATVTSAEAHMRPNALVKIRRSQNRLFQSGIVS